MTAHAPPDPCCAFSAALFTATAAVATSAGDVESLWPGWANQDAPLTWAILCWCVPGAKQPPVGRRRAAMAHPDSWIAPAHTGVPWALGPWLLSCMPGARRWCLLQTRRWGAGSRGAPRSHPPTPRPDKQARGQAAAAETISLTPNVPSR